MRLVDSLVTIANMRRAYSIIPGLSSDLRIDPPDDERAVDRERLRLARRPRDHDLAAVRADDRRVPGGPDALHPTAHQVDRDQGHERGRAVWAQPVQVDGEGRGEVLRRADGGDVDLHVVEQVALDAAVAHGVTLPPSRRPRSPWAG